MDLNMPKLSGAQATREIAASCPQVQIVVLTVSDQDRDVLEALAAGACGYLLKDAARDELVGGVRQAASGNAVLSRRVASAVVARVREQAAARAQHERRPPLTARELEVLRLIAAGADNVAIAGELFISPNTVKQHVANILEKLGVHSRVQAAVHGVRSGLL
jgi:DNA-binding NarL/FixJ family response regulator